VELIAAIFLFAIATSVSPGPNNIMVMSSGANYGIKQSFPMLAGICIGFPVMVITIGLGMGSIFKLYPEILIAMNIVGTLYLLYLAYLIGTASPQSIENNNSKPLTFVQAALFQWVNPKAWIMATGAVSAYVTSQSDPFNQIILIALVFFVISLPSVGVWLIFGVSLKSFMANRHKQKIFNMFMSMLLILSLLPALFSLGGQCI
jgi:threonine/homoserine/homoserine lactone efflux protein